jgi:hypothetical protein
MKDYFSIGSSPIEETCVQLGTENYAERAKQECKRFIELIRKNIGEEPDGAQLGIKGFDHDFGRYYEVVCYFDDSNKDAVDYAIRCEKEMPLKWEEV